MTDAVQEPLPGTGPRRLTTDEHLAYIAKCRETLRMHGEHRRAELPDDEVVDDARHLMALWGDDWGEYGAPDVSIPRTACGACGAGLCRCNLTCR